MEQKIGVGFGVLILKGGKVLLGKRNSDPEKAKSALHGEGTWTMPGGKLHFGESFEEGAYREVLEETGIKINKQAVEIINVQSNIVSDAHFVTIGLLCKDFEGEPKVMEPEEITEWKWFSLNNLPEPLYEASKNVLEKFLNKSLFSDLNPSNYKRYYNEKFKTVFLSIPSNLFHFRADISCFALEKQYAPLNPYMNFDYNMFNTVDKSTIRIANNNLIKKADELWVFSNDFNALTDGVKAEIIIAKENGKPIHFFNLPSFMEVEANTNQNIEHYGLKLKDDWKTVYTAITSKYFYYRTFISKYVLEKQHVPLNPFMLFDYFMADKVDRNAILYGNSKFIELADELWVFGPISDGVFAEIKLVEQMGKPVKYFFIDKNKGLTEISKEKAEIEEDVKHYL